MKPFYSLLKNLGKILVPFFVTCFLIQQTFAQAPGNTLNYSSGEQVTVPTGGLNVSGSFTVEAWVLPLNPSSTMSIFSTRSVGGDHTFDMKLEGGNTIHGDIGDGTSWITTAADASYNYTVGKWIHITYMISPARWDIYVNGKFVNGANFTGTPLLLGTSHTQMEIGNYGGEFFHGNIDEVKVYQGTRSALQLIGDMNEISDPSGEGNLFAYYKFDEGTAGGDNTSISTLTDASPNALSGDLHGFTRTGSTSNWIKSYAMVVPTPVAPSTVTPASFTARWDAPVLSSATSYVLEISDAADFSNIISTFTPSTTSQAVTGLGASTQYWYRVSAVNSSIQGQGAYSDTISVTTAVLPTASITGDITTCFNSGPVYVTFVAQDGTAPYTFTYKINSGSDKTITTTGTDNFIQLAVPTTTGGDFVYSLVSVADANAYAQAQSGTATVTVKAPADSTMYVTVCTSDLPYNWNGADHYGAGTYTYTTTSSGGCDSTITLTLSVTSTSNTLVTKNLDELPYNWNGADYYSGGVFTYTTTGSTACDSVATLRLTVNVPPPPADISYSTPNLFTKNVAISSLMPLAETQGSIRNISTGFYAPACIARDTSGNVYVTDAGLGSIFKILPGGKTTKLGKGSVNFPFAVAVDAAQNVFVTDPLEGSVKKISGIDGTVTLVASCLTLPEGIAVDGAGNIFVADPAAGAIVKIPLGGSPATFWENINGPVSIATDADGNIYTGDGAGIITKITADGAHVIPIGSLPDGGQPAGISVNLGGNVYVADSYNSIVYKISPDGTRSVVGNDFTGPGGVVSDPAGNLFVTDTYNGLVKKLTLVASNPTGYTINPALPQGLVFNTSSGVISGTPAVARKRKTYSITANNIYGHTNASTIITVTNAAGEVFGYNTPNTFIKNKGIQNLSPIQPLPPVMAGEIVKIGSGFNLPFGVAVDDDGNLYVADSYNAKVKRMSADGSTITEIGSGFSIPIAVAVDAAGNVYVSDIGNNTVKKIAADGIAVTELGVGLFDQPQGLTVDATGNVYVADYGHSEVKKITPDGTTVTIIGTGFDRPDGVAVDAAGNVYVADLGHAAIKRITPGNVTETLVNGLPVVLDVKVDSDGNIYVVSNNAVKKISADLTTSTTIHSAFNGPSFIALDDAGNIFVAETYNNAIKKIQGTGEIITRYTISPSLPDGLSLNDTTGIISGKPRAGSPSTLYTITAERSAGNLTAQVNMQVNVFDTAKVKVCSAPLPYNWNGVDYNAAGTYPGYFTNAGGFDSSLALRLTISNFTATLQPLTTTTACYGANKWIQVNATAGKVPYQYSLDGSTYQTSRSFLVPAGSYTATVQDALGCSAVTNTVVITQPADPLIITPAVVRTTCTGNDGSITINASGGYSSYLYSIDGGISYGGGNAFSGLAPAVYSVAVTDGNGCKIKKNVTVKPPVGICSSLIGSQDDQTLASAEKMGMLVVKVLPNPAVIEFNLQIVSGDSKNIVELRVMDMIGKVVHHTKGSVYDMYRFGRTFAAGMYVAEVLNGKNSQRIKLVKGN